ncbi:hypothetical protein Tco_0057735 [Tanacetum coccineum]
MNEAQILSYTLRKSAQEAEAQANIKLVEQYLLDEDINKIVEGDDADANEFADTEEASDEAALILKKGKNVMEDKDTPITTPTRSPRITLSSDKEKLQELMDNVSPSSEVPPSPSSIQSRQIQGEVVRMSRRYGHMMQNMKKTFIHKGNVLTMLKNVDDALKEVIPKIVTKTTDGIMKDNLPWLVVDNDPEAQADDSAIWDALRKKYEKSSIPPATYRHEASRKRESSSAKGTSSSKITIVPKPKTHASQPPVQEYNEWSMAQEVNEDEDISEEAKPEFLAEIQGGGEKEEAGYSLSLRFGQQATTTLAPPKTISKSVNGDFIAPPEFLKDVFGEPKMRSINELMTLEVFVEQLSRTHNCIMDKVTLPDGFSDFIKMQDPPEYRFPWGYRDIVVDREFWYPVAWQDVEKICGNRRPWWRMMKRTLPQQLTLYLNEHGVLQSKGIVVETYEIKYMFPKVVRKADDYRDYGVWLSINGGSITSAPAIMTMPSNHFLKLLGFNNHDLPIVEADIGHIMGHTVQVYMGNSQSFENVTIQGNVGSFFVGPNKESLILAAHPDHSLYCAG